MSTIDPTTLVATLQNAIHGGELALTGDLVSSPDLDPLLTEYFPPSGTVTITSASAQLSADQKSAVVGGSVTLGTAACAAAITLTPGASDVALVMTLTPSAGWTLPGPFPNVLDPAISAVSFAAGGIVICSGSYREPTQGLDLTRGMTVVATLDIGASFPYLPPVLNNVTTVPINGVVTDPQLPQMVLTTQQLPASLGSTTLANVSLILTLGNLAGSGQTPVGYASAGLQASMSLGHGVGGTVTASLPSGGSSLALDVAFENVNLGDLGLLTQFIADADPVASLPSEVSQAIGDAGSAFQLTSLALVFDIDAVKFKSMGIVVTIDLKGFAPFPALSSLKFDDVVIQWTLDASVTPIATDFSVTAELELTSTCPVSVGVETEDGNGYMIAVRQNTNAVLHLADIAAAVLPGLTLPTLDVKDFLLTLSPRESLYVLSAEIDGSWPVLADIGIELATVYVNGLYDGKATPALSGSIEGVLELELQTGAAAERRKQELRDAQDGDNDAPTPPPAVVDLELIATRPPGVDGWSFVGETGTDQVVPVGALVAAIAHKFSATATAPASIESLTVQNLSVQFDTVTSNFTFGCQVDIEIDSEPVEIVVAVSATKGKNGYEIAFGGTILVGSLEFDLYFDENGTSTSIVAVYTHKPGDPEKISLQQLVSEISASAAAEVPSDIEIQLDGVKLVFVKQGDATEFAFSLDLSLSFGLADLPLVGEVLPPEQISIEHLQFMYSTATLTQGEANDINGRLPSTVAPLPAAGLSPGPAASATVVYGSTQLPVAFGVPSTTTSPMLVATTASTPGTVVATTDGPTSQPTAHWFDIQKTIGPVSIGRIGVQYQSGALFFLLDASLSLAALTVGLDGLGLGSPLSEFSLAAHLDGLSIGFSDGPVMINGGFLVVSSPPPGVTDEYMGELTIAIEPYLISGVGAYAKVDGATSFFVFAEVDGEFGGPPAFFVTGFMGGVGYNWSLTLPPAEEVYTFPFVAGLGNPTFFGQANPTPIQVLNALSGQGGKTAWVTPSLGENWIAAGIQFRSFELVIGRALLVVEFGKQFEVALLGLATISLPQNVPAEAYAYVELQLEVVLKPDDGIFSAVASLTPNSYLLTRQCHLTGGFAFYLWFGSNPHAGDFVLTIGGYHPAFKPLPWYPTVPQLGFNWSVDNDIVIKGGAYFAITPTAAMAGGNLQVLFQSGDLKAWLTAYANIMIRWRPFYLTAGIGVSVGVSYRLDLGFTSVTLSVELGATLSLWGPPTGGVANIDWYIISFSVGFGAGEASPDDLTLDWKGFSALLPNSSSNQSNKPAAFASPLYASDAQSQPVILGLSINRGLLSTDSVTKDWIVRADELILTTSSAVPLTSITLGSVDVTMPPDTPATIDIRPMSVSGVTCAHTITVTPQDTVENEGVEQVQPLPLTDWPAPAVQIASRPEALWGQPIPETASPAPTAKLITNLAVGLTFAPPPATAGAAVGPLDPSTLVSPIGNGEMPLDPSAQADPIAEPVPDKDSILAIIADVASHDAILAQQALVTVLSSYEAPPPTSDPLTELGQQAGALFSQPPMVPAS
jgi:hypothetical protein